MAIELTNLDFQALEEQAQQRGEQIYQVGELGVLKRLPKQLGEGCDRIFNLRDGLTVSIRQGTLRQSIRHLHQHESQFPLVAKFYLSGMSRVQTLDAWDIDRDYQEQAGCHYLYHLPDHTEVEEWPADQLIHGVMVLADIDYFRSFGRSWATSSQATLPKPLLKLLKGDTKTRFHQPLGRMTPHLRQLLQSIVHCPYSGLMQQLYLESKALELLTAQFAAWAEQPSDMVSVSLSADDVHQLHQARDILTQRAKQPPSLMELARLVGLNDRKLNQGFRRLFGTTVFSYLQAYRLQQARELLQDNNLTVAAVAATVGYRNPEAFSTAFRRKFSVSPKSYQLSRRG
ncbi:MAG: AraC family transcriptional regulator [Cyanobacteria bacterium P01_G01_bin.38]